MNIVYIRVSSVDQNENWQIKTMEREDSEKYFKEKVSVKCCKAVGRQGCGLSQVLSSTLFIRADRTVMFL
jgi:hypothetical protein